MGCAERRIQRVRGKQFEGREVDREDHCLNASRKVVPVDLAQGLVLTRN